MRTEYKNFVCPESEDVYKTVQTVTDDGVQVNVGFYKCSLCGWPGLASWVKDANSLTTTEPEACFNPSCVDSFGNI